MGKTTFLIALLLCVVLMLSGCIYSSANLIRAQGKKITVLCPSAYVNCIDSSVTLYRSTDAISYLKDKDAKYPKVPTRPTISEEAESSSFNAGKAEKLAPKAATPQPDDSGIIPAVAGVLTK